MVRKDEPGDIHTEISSDARHFREILLMQSDMVNYILHQMFQSRNNNEPLGNLDPLTVNVVSSLIYATGVSIPTIMLLTNEIKLQVRDAYGVARSVFEGFLNASLILIEGRSLAERAYRHAVQKRARMHNREQTSSDLKLVAKISLMNGSHSEKEIEKMKSEFSNKRGREKPWIDLTTSQKIEKICLRMSLPYRAKLSLSSMLIYQISSEILHSSLFGAQEFLDMGGTGGPFPASKDGLISHMNGHIDAVLIPTILAIHGFVDVYTNHVDDRIMVGANKIIWEKLEQSPFLSS
jgi:hypothetical protein